MDTIGTRHRIARWLRPLFELEPPTRPERVVIQHVSVNDKYAEVATFPFAPEATEEHLAELAENVDAAVTADAEGLGGLQRYVVAALRGADQITRLPLRVSGTEMTADGEPLDSEPATMKGVLAQLMRHLEAQARMFTLGYGQVLSVMQRTISRQQAAVEAAEDVRLESVALAERMMSEQHERDLSVQNTQHEVDTREKMFNKISDLLSLGAAHVLTPKDDGNGKPAAPAPPSTVGVLLKQLFESLGEDQIEELRKVLTLEQFLVISRLVQETGVGGTPPDQGGTAAAPPGNGAGSQNDGPSGAPPPNTANSSAAPRSPAAAAPSSSVGTAEHRNTKKRRRS